MIRIKVAPGARYAMYGASRMDADDDGIVSVPRIALLELLSEGCTAVDAIDPPLGSIDDELRRATRAELHYFLVAHGNLPAATMDLVVAGKIVFGRDDKGMRTAMRRPPMPDAEVLDLAMAAAARAKRTAP